MIESGPLVLLAVPLLAAVECLTEERWTMTSLPPSTRLENS